MDDFWEIEGGKGAQNESFWGRFLRLLGVRIGKWCTCVLISPCRSNSRSSLSHFPHKSMKKWIRNVVDSRMCFWGDFSSTFAIQGAPKSPQSDPMGPQWHPNATLKWMQIDANLDLDRSGGPGCILGAQWHHFWMLFVRFGRFGGGFLI